MMVFSVIYLASVLSMPFVMFEVARLLWRESPPLTMAVLITLMGAGLDWLIKALESLP